MVNRNKELPILFFEDKQQINVTYSCRCIQEDSGAVRIECQFHESFPIQRITFYHARDYDYEKDLQLKIEKAWNISEDSLEDVYENEDWESCYQKYPIITGFNARIRMTKDTPINKIEQVAKKWIKELTQFIIAPTVRVKPNYEFYPENHIIIDTRPENLKNMKPPAWYDL